MTKEEIMNKRPAPGYGFIYKYTSPSGKSYIGKTIHTLKERAGSNGCRYTRHSTKFSTAIKKYSWNNFIPKIIEEVQEDLLNEREIYWVNYYDTLNNGYNTDNPGQGGCQPKYKVYQYDLNGNLINSYSCASEAAKILKTSVASIRSCCNKQILTVHNSILRYGKLEQNFKLPSKTTPGKAIPIKQLDLNNGNLIKIYPSYSEAARNLNISIATIALNVIGRQKSAGGYNFKPLNEEEKIIYAEQIKPKTSAKSVHQINKDTGEIIATYSSMTKAQEKTGIDNRRISEACKKKNKTAGGFKWEYA